MNPDYTIAQMMADIAAVVQDGMLYIIPAAIFLGAINFIVVGFVSTVYSIGRRSWHDR